MVKVTSLTLRNPSLPQDLKITQVNLPSQPRPKNQKTRPPLLTRPLPIISLSIDGLLQGQIRGRQGYDAQDSDDETPQDQ